MFDDHIQKPGNVGTPPPNLPMGEPEDMFSDSPEEGMEQALDSTASSVPAGLMPLQQDGFSSDPTPGTALQAGILRPAQPRPQMMASTPMDQYGQARPLQEATQYGPNPAQPSSVNPQQMYATQSSGGAWKIVLIVLIILLLLGGIGWVAYEKFFATAVVTPVENNGTPKEETPSPEQTPPVQEETTEPPLNENLVDDSLLFGQPIDADGDGLDDERETSIGTDPKNWDTDGDELSDGDEVIIWKTDPINPDTDADTFSDGSEVRAGYSPTGAGRLFEPPTATTTP